MFGVKVVTVKGKVTNIGGGTTSRNAQTYDFIEIETETGPFRSGRVVTAKNIDAVIRPGLSGLFVFGRYFGRNLVMVAPEGEPARIGPAFTGQDWLTPALYAFLASMLGLLLLPAFGVGLLFFALALHLLILPGRIRKRLAAIAESEGLDWTETTRKDDF